MPTTLGRKEARGPSLAQMPTWPQASRWPPWDLLPSQERGRITQASNIKLNSPMYSVRPRAGVLKKQNQTS